MGNQRTDAKERQRLRRRLESRGATPAQADAAAAALRRHQDAIRAEVAAWRRRHPRLAEATIRLIVAETRRQHRGAA